MATCRECLHYEVCAEWAEDIFGIDNEFPYEEETGERLCEHYTPKSDYVKRDAYVRMVERFAIEPKQNWISVKDKLPDMNEMCLLCMENRTTKYRWVTIGYFHTNYDEYVTHWQPLPEPPKGE